MDNVIEKTKELINALDNSELISHLDYYKKRVLLNRNLLELIDRYNTSNDNYEKISLKQEIYKDSNYKEYMKYYNELFFYILKINRKFKEYTSLKRCHKCE